MVNPLTISQRLHEDLKQVIAATGTGERLPSEPDLAHQLGVSRATLREAMRTFETQGLIRRRQGSGTYVMRPAHVMESGIEILESIETIALRSGLPVNLGELKVTNTVAGDEVVGVLGVDPGSEVIYVSRVILAEDRPVAYLIDIVPETILSAEEVRSGFSGSILDLLLSRGEPQLANSHCEIGAVAATPDVARALNIQRGTALLCFVSRLYSLDGTVVDYSFSYFLPGYFRFHVVRELGRRSPAAAVSSP